MNGQASTCALTLNDVYVESINFKRYDNFLEKDVSLSFKIGSEVEKSEDNKECKACIDIIIKDKNEGKLLIEIKYVGIFGITNLSGLNNKQQEDIIKKNTIAILFPFVRSFIATITSQTGIKPIILPPINVNSLIENNLKKKKNELS
ncbi:protein-export chaperone SecB [Clostridium sporogenes]|uniref:protein-export chaperone SecB n=1 Tax=Clostridium sporogenes TaxID=1509 RepID=UPI0029044129|nr:protein-export chaperone SecB [Clostridium botulinum]